MLQLFKDGTEPKLQAWDGWHKTSTLRPPDGVRVLGKWRNGSERLFYSFHVVDPEEGFVFFDLNWTRTTEPEHWRPFEA